jgi:hypothetical protein
LVTKKLTTGWQLNLLAKFLTYGQIVNMQHKNQI